MAFRVAAGDIEPFHYRITCHDEDVNSDDFDYQYSIVME